MRDLKISSTNLDHKYSNTTHLPVSAAYLLNPGVKSQVSQHSDLIFSWIIFFPPP